MNGPLPIIEEEAADSESTKHIISVLKQYQELVSDGPESQINIVSKIKDEIDVIVDNYIHIINQDEFAIDAIQKSLGTCDASTCPIIRQYYNLKATGHPYMFTEESESQDVFWINLMNTIHCNLMHNDTKHMDEVTKQLTSRFQAKYTVPVHQNEESTLDYINDYVAKQSEVKSSDFQKLTKFLKDEDYDTESIKYDINSEQISSNLAMLNPQITESIKQYLYITHCML